MHDDPHTPGDTEGPDSADESVTADMELNEPEDGSVTFSAGFGGGDTSPFPLYTWPRAWLDRTDINSPQMAEGLGDIAARQAEAVAHYISALTEAQADLKASPVLEAAAVLEDIGQGFVLFHQFYTGGMIPTRENLEEEESRRRFAEEEDRFNEEERLRLDEGDDFDEPGPPQNEFGVPLAISDEVSSGPWGRIAVSAVTVHSNGVKVVLTGIFQHGALNEVFPIDPFSVVEPGGPDDEDPGDIDQDEAEQRALLATYAASYGSPVVGLDRDWFETRDPDFEVATQPLWIASTKPDADPGSTTNADITITASFPAIRVTDAVFSIPAASIAEARTRVVTVTADSQPW